MKPETHDLIIKIQNMLGSDQDKAIAAACGMFYSELSARKKEQAASKKQNLKLTYNENI